MNSNCLNALEALIMMEKFLLIDHEGMHASVLVHKCACIRIRDLLISVPFPLHSKVVMTCRRHEHDIVYYALDGSEILVHTLWEMHS